MKLKPDVDLCTCRVEAREGRTLRDILKEIGLDPAFVAFASHSEMTDR